MEKYYGHEPIGARIKFCVVLGTVLGIILTIVAVS